MICLLVLVPYCDAHSDFHVKSMFGLSSCPLVLKRIHDCYAFYMNSYIGCSVFIVVLYICGPFLSFTFQNYSDEYHDFREEKVEQNVAFIFHGHLVSLQEKKISTE